MAVNELERKKQLANTLREIYPDKLRDIPDDQPDKVLAKILEDEQIKKEATGRGVQPWQLVLEKVANPEAERAKRDLLADLRNPQFFPDGADKIPSDATLEEAYRIITQTETVQREVAKSKKPPYAVIPEIIQQNKEKQFIEDIGKQLQQLREKLKEEMASTTSLLPAIAEKQRAMTSKVVPAEATAVSPEYLTRERREKEEETVKMLDAADDTYRKLKSLFQIVKDNPREGAPMLWRGLLYTLSQDYLNLVPFLGSVRQAQVQHLTNKALNIVREYEQGRGGEIKEGFTPDELDELQKQVGEAFANIIAGQQIAEGKTPISFQVARNLPQIAKWTAEFLATAGLLKSAGVSDIWKLEQLASSGKLLPSLGKWLPEALKFGLLAPLTPTGITQVATKTEELMQPQVKVATTPTGGVQAKVEKPFAPQLPVALARSYLSTASDYFTELCGEQFVRIANGAWNKIGVPRLLSKTLGKVISTDEVQRLAKASGATKTQDVLKLVFTKGRQWHQFVKPMYSGVVSEYLEEAVNRPIQELLETGKYDPIWTTAGAQKEATTFLSVGAWSFLMGLPGASANVAQKLLENRYINNYFNRLDETAKQDPNVKFVYVDDRGEKRSVSGKWLGQDKNTIRVDVAGEQVEVPKNKLLIPPINSVLQKEMENAAININNTIKEAPEPEISVEKVEPTPESKVAGGVSEKDLDRVVGELLPKLTAIPATTLQDIAVEIGKRKGELLALPDQQAVRDAVLEIAGAVSGKSVAELLPQKEMAEIPYEPKPQEPAVKETAKEPVVTETAVEQPTIQETAIKETAITETPPSVEVSEEKPKAEIQPPVEQQVKPQEPASETQFENIKVRTPSNPAKVEGREGRNVIIEGHPHIYANKHIVLEDRTPAEVEQWRKEHGTGGETVSIETLRSLYPKQKTTPVKLLGFQRDSDNPSLIIAHLDAGVDYSIPVDAKYYRWLTKNGYTIKSTGEQRTPLVLEKNGKDVGLLSQLSHELAVKIERAETPQPSPEAKTEEVAVEPTPPTQPAPEEKLEGEIDEKQLADTAVHYWLQSDRRPLTDGFPDPLEPLPQDVIKKCHSPIDWTILTPLGHSLRRRIILQTILGLRNDEVVNRIINWLDNPSADTKPIAEVFASEIDEIWRWFWTEENRERNRAYARMWVLSFYTGVKLRRHILP